jgi:hypothetical protein
MKRIALRPLRTRRFDAALVPVSRAVTSIEKSPAVRLTARRQLAVAGLTWLFAAASRAGR